MIKKNEAWLSVPLKKFIHEKIDKEAEKSGRSKAKEVPVLLKEALEARSGK